MPLAAALPAPAAAARRTATALCHQQPLPSRPGAACWCLPPPTRGDAPRSQQPGAPTAPAPPTAAAASPPAVWCQGLWQRTFAQEVAQVFPEVTWQPGDLVKALACTLPAAGAAVAINSRLQAWLLGARQGSSSVVTSLASDSSSSSSSSSLDASIHSAALLHLGQEAVLALLLTAACRLALGPRVLRASPPPPAAAIEAEPGAAPAAAGAAAGGTRYWLLQTAGTCLLLFPVVDPLLSGAWAPVAGAVAGLEAPSPLVATLQQAAGARQWGALAQHCVASGLLGPLWEEVFWRGFFLTALTKVLPVRGCVALSAANFAALHLSAANALPLAVLGGCCDALYLRSGGNLAAPLLLHSAWNVSQVLQVALLGKQAFV